MVAVSLKKAFFQAEDGIRDRDVTGVQTCALPIYINDCTVCGKAYKTRATIANHVVIHVVHINDC